MSATIVVMSWWWKEHLHTGCKKKLSLQSRVSKEHAKDIKDEDVAEEEEGLVEVEDRLYATTVEHHGTMRESVRIKHARNVNTATSLPTP